MWNKQYLEGAIIEGYFVEEFGTFCCRYLVDVEMISNRTSRNLREVHDDQLTNSYLFVSDGESIGKVEVTLLNDESWAQVHRYVLLNHEAIATLQM